MRLMIAAMAAHTRGGDVDAVDPLRGADLPPWPWTPPEDDERTAEAKRERRRQRRLRNSHRRSTP